MYRRGNRGLTFIELLLLIGLSFILLVLLLPVFVAARQKGRKTECLSNLRQLGLALHLYAQDYDQYFPPYLNRLRDERGESTRWDAPELLYEAVVNVTNNSAVFFCPEDTYARQDIDVFGVNHRYSSYRYNLTPPPAYDGTITVYGLQRGSVLITPPADYVLIKDANTGQTEYVDGRRAYGCNHLGGINRIYVDLHSNWVKNE